MKKHLQESKLYVFGKIVRGKTKNTITTTYYKPNLPKVICLGRLPPGSVCRAYCYSQSRYLPLLQASSSSTGISSLDSKSSLSLSSTPLPISLASFARRNAFTIGYPKQYTNVINRRIPAAPAARVDSVKLVSGSENSWIEASWETRQTSPCKTSINHKHYGEYSEYVRAKTLWLTHLGRSENYECVFGGRQEPHTGTPAHSPLRYVEKGAVFLVQSRHISLRESVLHHQCAL